MKIRSLHVSNFRRHRDTRIEFPDGVTSIIGPNGSGKSSLVEAISFALFGVPAARTSKELLRWAGAAPGDAVSVDLQLELGGSALRIVRELRGKNLVPSASLHADGSIIVPPGTSSNQAVTEEVTKRLGMDRDGFHATVVARQKELSRLGDMGAADRKRLLLQLLGVDAVDRAIKEARGRGRDARVAAEAVRASLPDAKVLAAATAEAADGVQRAEQAAADAVADAAAAKAALAQAEAAKAQAEAAFEAARDAATRIQELTAANAARKQELEAATAMLSAAHEARERLASVEAVAAAVAGLRERVEAARQAADAFGRRRALEKRMEAVPAPPDPGQELAAAKDLVTDLAAALGHAREHLAAARALATEAKGRAARVSDLGAEAPCPTCERPLGDHLVLLQVDVQDAQAAASAEAERWETECKDVEARHATAVGRQAELERAQNAHDTAMTERTRLAEEIKGLPDAPPPDLPGLREQLAAAEAAYAQATEARARIEAVAGAEQRIRHLQQAIQASDAEAQPLQPVAASFTGVQAQRKDAAAAEQAARLRERTASDAAIKADAARAQATQTLEAAKQRQADAQEQQAILRWHESAQKTWNGVADGRGHGLLERFRAHLVARIGPSVSAEAGRLLAAFTGGRYTEVRLDADYNLFVADGGVLYTLDRFSGGETDLVHLALRLAVSRLLAERADAEVRLLVLDEVFGSLDHERRDLVLGALAGLGAYYGQILLVTHQDALRDALDAAITVDDAGAEAHAVLRNG